MYNANRRVTKGAVASLEHGSKVARKHDMLEGTAVSSDESDSTTDSDAPLPPADVGVMYSFDASRGPSHGSQILNVALAKAVEKFEEKETVKLVKNEYEVLDSEGESLGLTPSSKRSKAKANKAKTEMAITAKDDEDYEFV